MTLNIFLGLIFCNLIWSFHPILGKWLLDAVSPPQAAWLKYGSALLGYWVIVAGLKFLPASFLLAIVTVSGPAPALRTSLHSFSHDPLVIEFYLLPWGFLHSA